MSATSHRQSDPRSAGRSNGPTPAGTRLPATDALPSRGVQILLGLLALLATAFIVVGVPILLWSAFGSPWPDNGFSMEWLTSPSSTEAVMSILATVVWLAWAHFVICLVVEAVAERRKRGLAPRVPGGGVGTQAVARRLIATIALIAGTAAATVGPASAAVGATSGPSAQSSISGTVTPTSQIATSAVNAATANAAADRAVEGALPDADELLRATPADAAEGITTFYEVKPPEGRNYDTMWDIAERYLGSGVRYKEVWELNKHLKQADGRSLQHADLIHPGWVLKLPNDARGPGLRVVEHASIAATGGAVGADGAVDSATPAGADLSASTGGQAGGATEAGGGIVDAIFAEQHAPLFGVAGGLAMAGAFLGLRRRRSAPGTHQHWAEAVRRTAGRPDPTDPTDPDPNNPGPGGPGPRLRDESNPTLAGWISSALRSLGGGSTPAIARAWAGNSGLAVAFDEDPGVEPPAPWTAPGARTWALPRGARVVASGPSAAPGAVTVGAREDGSLAMVDPESVAGLIALTADDTQARGLAMSMAVDTATHPWADHRQVTMVGFADDLSRVAQGVITRTDDLSRVLEELENQARHQRQACRAAGVESAREGRQVAPDAIDWRYHLVLCSGVPVADQLARLTALAADPQFSLGVVVVGEVPDAAMSLATRADGSLVAPLHGLEATTQVLSVKAVRDLMSLYDIEESPRGATLDTLVGRIEAESFAAASDDAPVRVDVIGPVRVSAPGEVAADRQEFLTELATYLAVHPDGVHANRISAALWPRGVDPAVRDSALAQVSAWFGTTADAEPVLVEESGVWRVRPGAVRLDWDAFRGALNAAADHPLSAEEHLRTALGMVRGEPFADVPASRYSWLEATPLVADIALAVSLTTLAVSEAAIGSGDTVSARRTLLEGLELMPANEELWCSLLHLESRDDDGARLQESVERMYAAIAEYGSPVGASARTDALVDELLPGYRSRVA